MEHAKLKLVRFFIFVIFLFSMQEIILNNIRWVCDIYM